MKPSAQGSGDELTQWALVRSNSFGKENENDLQRAVIETTLPNSYLSLEFRLASISSLGGFLLI